MNEINQETQAQAQAQAQTQTNLKGDNTMLEEKTMPAFNNALEKERFKEVVIAFKEYFNSDQVEKLRFKHFILYAMIRGQDVAKVTHSVDSEKFNEEIRLINAVAVMAMENKRSSYLEDLVLPFKLDRDEFIRVVNEYKA